jgi:hypothetical protein
VGCFCSYCCAFRFSQFLSGDGRLIRRPPHRVSFHAGSVAGAARPLQAKSAEGARRAPPGARTFSLAPCTAAKSSWMVFFIAAFPVRRHRTARPFPAPRPSRRPRGSTGSCRARRRAACRIPPAGGTGTSLSPCRRAFTVRLLPGQVGAEGEERRQVRSLRKRAAGSTPAVARPRAISVSPGQPPRLAVVEEA